MLNMEKLDRKEIQIRICRDDVDEKTDRYMRYSIWLCL